MKFAVAKDLITPDKAMPLGGYSSYHGNTFRGIHDDLFVKALLLDDGKVRLLFVAVDLVFYDYRLTLIVRQYAKERCGIAEDALFLTYTHTHSGPATPGYGDPEYDGTAYEQFLLDRIRSCIDRAMLNPSVGTIASGFIEGDWNINRRKKENGIVQLAPNPDGAKDDRLHVLKLCDEEGRIRCIVINYACHPVTVRDTPLVSGDFPGRICQLLEAACYGATVLFFQGAGGNLRPKATARGSRFATLTHAEIDEMATAIVERIKTALWSEKTLRRFEPSLAAVQFEIPLALEPLPKETLAAAADDEQLFIGTRRLARRLFEQYEQLPDEKLLPGGVARLGEAVYVAYMGGEPCCEVKRNLEPLFAGKQLLFFGYADATAYIPDDQLNEEGGYEASGSTLEYGLKGPFKSGIDRSMETAFRNALSAAHMKADAGSSRGGGEGNGTL
ncbi:neutral/alkaline non-lysosomal ceramidase N-terminal domain-containing protein [Paenibacillus cymbidii]|uniref:neutral/alkaline non-lysosomal ceramidase N-terminal domain-containing protein n=1 Tax=Paenibacillus cymbidii TaxID=1639034 RepID=UPI0010823081|nr:neutral/alkaline non-lysosomal ceramidase N-terminal domain-containing protein [Paenibacillus cymbidii]